MTRLLIPGANGRLGPLLRGALADDPDTRAKVIFAARSGPADLRLDAEVLPPEISQADMVVGLWGATAGSEEALAQNAKLVAATQAVARAAGASKILHLSTAGIYGPGTDLSEDHTLNPPGAYGAAKHALEEEVARRPLPGIDQCCLRLANVVGADSLAPALTAAPDRPVYLTRFADGRGPLRSYIAPGHLMEILMAFAEVPAGALPDVLNIAASQPVEMEAICRAALRPIVWIDPTPDDRQLVTLSTARLAALLPGTPLARSAEEMVRDWQTARAAADAERQE